VFLPGSFHRPVPISYCGRFCSVGATSDLIYFVFFASFFVKNPIKSKYPMKSFYYTVTVVFLSLLTTTGCSMSKLLVGHVDAVDQKSSTIQVTPVELIDPSWKRIEISESAIVSNDMPDRAWQSTKTASVISLNSACRQSNDKAQSYGEMGLKEITADLLSQWNDLENKTEREFLMSGFPAFETTADGMYVDRKRKFQTIVVKTPTCVYDLIFLSPFKSYSQDLAVFQKFRDKLILK
jgi:hypothetical protein